jgi:hypothetical protein
MKSSMARHEKGDFHKTSLYLISASVDPCTVKHAHTVTSIKQPPVIKKSPFSCLAMEDFISIEPL